jgi:hypothetical protein
MRQGSKTQEFVKGNKAKNFGWRQVVVLGLICALLPGCAFTAARVFIPLAYAGIGMGIALLVSPSVTAAIVGFVLGGVIGAAVYNNSLKTDIMERQERFRGDKM